MYLIKFIILINFLIFSHYSYSYNNYNAHDFSFKTIKGSEIKLSEYQNNLLMIVNISSQCGFTKQHVEIEKIWYKYKNKGLMILAVPSSDFISNKSYDPKDQKICKTSGNRPFLMSKEYNVTGDKAHPFFKWVASEEGNISLPKGNFYKYLISKDGQIIDWYASDTPATSNKIIETIEENL